MLRLTCLWHASGPITERRIRDARLFSLVYPWDAANQGSGVAHVLHDRAVGLKREEHSRSTPVWEPSMRGMIKSATMNVCVEGGRSFHLAPGLSLRQPRQRRPPPCEAPPPELWPPELRVPPPLL